MNARRLTASMIGNIPHAWQMPQRPGGPTFHRPGREAGIKVVENRALKARHFLVHFPECRALGALFQAVVYSRPYGRAY